MVVSNGSHENRFNLVRSNNAVNSIAWELNNVIMDSYQFSRSLFWLNENPERNCAVDAFTSGGINKDKTN